VSDNVFPFDNGWWRLDKVLTARRRLKRRYGAPDWLENEFAEGTAYPFTTGEVLPGCEIRFRRTGWRKVGYEQSLLFEKYKDEEPENRPHLKVRFTVGWLYVGGERLGCVRLEEYDLLNLYNAEFYDLMDEVDSETEELAVALLHWPYVQMDVGDYGNVIHLSSVWQVPSLAKRRVGEIALLSFIMPKLEKASILILKAFPYEYAGRVPAGAKTAIGFGRRRQAMMRMAERRLGVMRMPGDIGEEGWMWRPSPRLKAIMAMPTREPHLSEDD